MHVLSHGHYIKYYMSMSYDPLKEETCILSIDVFLKILCAQLQTT